MGRYYTQVKILRGNCDEQEYFGPRLEPFDPEASVVKSADRFAGGVPFIKRRNAIVIARTVPVNDRESTS